MPESREELPVKTVTIVQEGTQWFKIYSYPNRKVRKSSSGEKVYWFWNTRKVPVDDPHRRPGKKKLDKTRVIELLKAMSKEQHAEMLQYARDLLGTG